MSENKKCSMYLGVVIAEQLCEHLFNDIERMPFGHPGYDFICNRNMKIDVKSGCITLSNKKNKGWEFHIGKNTTADYFLIVAFDNRVNQEPQHLWLIPGLVLNHLKGNAKICPSTIDKWDEYMQPIGPAIACCNAIKKNNN
ncbi:MAG: hypothetical protein MUO43_08345 [Desulfobacterales bacterium]|nr:hypothetical protein [Desulfobacterales bacterium]